MTEAPVRVLVVDDDPTSRRLMTALLARDLRIEARVVSDALQALTETATFAPEVLVIDLGMAGIDGFGLVRALRDLRLADGVPIVALSAYDVPEYRAWAKDAGIDVFLGKPVDTRTMPDVAFTQGKARRQALREGANATDASSVPSAAAWRLATATPAARPASPVRAAGGPSVLTA